MASFSFEVDHWPLEASPDMIVGAPDWDRLLAPRVESISVRARALDRLLGVGPDFLSLAGGYPADESFPFKLIPELYRRAREQYPQLLQYGKAAGLDKYREILIPYLTKLGVAVCDPENVIITSGSQGAIDTLAKIFVVSTGEKRTKIAVTEPTYLGFLSGVAAFEADFIIVESDADGPLPSSLSDAFTQGADMAYAVSTFDNPTGKTITLARRKELVYVLHKWRKPIIEDDPYNRLRYEGEDVQTMQSLAPDNVIYLTSMSKVLAPGFRLGVVVAPKAVVKHLVEAKPDLCTGNLVQGLAGIFIAEGYIWEHIEHIKRLYRPRRDAMLEALEHHFPNTWQWTYPEGGMFIWAEGPEGVDVEAIYEKAYARKVAFLTGAAFCPDPQSPLGRSTMRLNFTNQSEANIQTAIATLGDIISEDLSV